MTATQTTPAARIQSLLLQGVWPRLAGTALLLVLVWLVYGLVV